MNTPLALRLIACGLPIPTFRRWPAPDSVDEYSDGGTAEWDTDKSGRTSYEVHLEIGDTCRPFGIAPSAGLLFTCVLTDAGLQLLPVLDDFALLGWVILELERVTGAPVGITHYFGDCMVAFGDECRSAPTRIEALTAALESAKEASK